MQKSTALSCYAGGHLEKGCCLFDQVYEGQHAVVSVQLIIFNGQTVLWLTHQQRICCCIILY